MVHLNFKKSTSTALSIGYVHKYIAIMGAAAYLALNDYLYVSQIYDSVHNHLRCSSSYCLFYIHTYVYSVSPTHVIHLHACIRTYMYDCMCIHTYMLLVHMYVHLYQD